MPDALRCSVPLITEKHSALAEVCRRFNVRRLELFGSATSQRDFDPERSDLDFLVEWPPNQDLGPWLAHYFDLKTELEGLFNRRVDLIMASAPKNPFFIAEMNRTRQLVYEAEDSLARASEEDDAGS